jgi:hypothetical protein
MVLQWMKDRRGETTGRRRRGDRGGEQNRRQL